MGIGHVVIGPIFIGRLTNEDAWNRQKVRNGSTNDTAAQDDGRRLLIFIHHSSFSRLKARPGPKGATGTRKMLL